MLFQQGDRVRVLVIGMEKNYSRISFSTAELEAEDGEMVENKVRSLAYIVSYFGSCRYKLEDLLV